MFTIDPEPCSSIGPRAARVARSPVKKFIWSAHSNSSSLVARKPSTRIRTAPTLLTSTSSRPCSSIAFCTSSAGPSSAIRSTATAVTPVQAVQVLGRPRPGDDVGALGDQRLGDREPDALVGAGDDRDLVSQVKVHRSRPPMWPARSPRPARRGRRRASCRPRRRPPASPRRPCGGADGPRTRGSRSWPASARSACTAPSTATPGTVWSSAAPTISSGARSAFLKWTSVGGCRWKFANPAS